ncbi:MAG: methionine--tRNA ligase beta chain [Planctomycetota bacterium]|jgi:methionine--tRNA ligase beta chain
MYMQHQKTNVLLLHGMDASPDMHWYGWLTEELGKHDIRVIAPQLPLGGGQTKEVWLAAILEHREHIHENTIAIGHSLGGAVMLSLLPELDISIKKTYFIAGFGRPFSSDDPHDDEVCSPFVAQVSWKKVRKKANDMVVVFSTDDSSVPVSESVFLGSMLQSPMRPILNAGHFVAEDGYTKFQWLLDDILATHYVQYEEFSKMDMRIGQIKEVEPVGGSDKLLRFQIDFGETDLRQIVSGIRGYVPEYETLVDKKVLYIINLAPRMIMGIESRGMLMAMGDEQTPLVFLTTDTEVVSGSRVR